MSSNNPWSVFFFLLFFSTNFIFTFYFLSSFLTLPHLSPFPSVPIHLKIRKTSKRSCPLQYDFFPTYYHWVSPCRYSGEKKKEIPCCFFCPTRLALKNSHNKHTLERIFHSLLSQKANEKKKWRVVKNIKWFCGECREGNKVWGSQKHSHSTNKKKLKT